VKYAYVDIDITKKQPSFKVEGARLEATNSKAGQNQSTGNAPTQHLIHHLLVQMMVQIIVQILSNSSLRRLKKNPLLCPLELHHTAGTSLGMWIR